MIILAIIVIFAFILVEGYVMYNIFTANAAGDYAAVILNVLAMVPISVIGVVLTTLVLMAIDEDNKKSDYDNWDQ